MTRFYLIKIHVSRSDESGTDSEETLKTHRKKKRGPGRWSSDEAPLGRSVRQMSVCFFTNINLLLVFSSNWNQRSSLCVQRSHSSDILWSFQRIPTKPLETHSRVFGNSEMVFSNSWKYSSGLQLVKSLEKPITPWRVFRTCTVWNGCQDSL